MTHQWKSAAAETAVTVLASIGSVPTAVQGTGESGCDRLAQPPRAAMGSLPALDDWVSFAELGWPGARPACAKAMADALGEVRSVAFAARAADEGRALAQANLGVMFQQGQGGLAKSDREAERPCRLAADRGFPAAQTGLVTLCVQARGGPQLDDCEAARSFRLAANSGKAQAQNASGRLYAERRRGLG